MIGKKRICAELAKTFLTRPREEWLDLIDQTNTGPAGPVNSASIAGTSQMTRSHSSISSAERAVAPLMRTLRPTLSPFALRSPSVPVPISTSPNAPATRAWIANPFPAPLRIRVARGAPPFNLRYVDPAPVFLDQTRIVVVYTNKVNKIIYRELGLSFDRFNNLTDVEMRGQQQVPAVLGAGQSPATGQKQMSRKQHQWPARQQVQMCCQQHQRPRRCHHHSV